MSINKSINPNCQRLRCSSADFVGLTNVYITIINIIIIHLYSPNAGSNKIIKETKPNET